MARKKKKRLSVKKILFLIIPIIILVGLFLFHNNILNYVNSKLTGYKYETIEVFQEQNIYDKIKNSKYSKTLEEIINTKYYNEEFLEDYLNINYQDNDNFFENINSLLELGYSYKDINNIYKYLDDDNISVLINNNYVDDISNILELEYFKIDYFKRYIEYINDEDIDSETAVLYVNIGLDQKYYTNVINIDNPEDILVIVNKYHMLDKDFVPSDLEAINTKYNRGNNNKMRHEAKIHFEEMCEAALKDNITIYSGSAYRSYSYQLGLYNRYVANYGFDEAETFSARAGYSEHQTGLATDIMNARLDFISASDKEYDWLVNNSYKYGFILRYPKGKENITGYMYEEWHFRYFGLNIAKELYNQDITYEEYLGKK